MLYDKLIHWELIEKGWSGDRKYRAEDRYANPYLVRIAPQERYERRKATFEHMQLVSQLDIPMPLPLECGLCNDGAYTIESWIEGLDAEETIPTLPEAQQYELGLESGRILKKIHSLPAPDNRPDWEEYFNRKIDRKIASYENCDLKYPGGDVMLEYLKSNRHLLKNRPQCYQHGDYHIGNMLLDIADDRLVIIDFEKDDFGDPWEEFNRIVWDAQAAPAFASGLVDGYFGGAVPMEFWRLLALYICSNSLGSLPWAIPYGEEEVATMQKQAADILSWYDHMTRIIPTWYRKL